MNKGQWQVSHAVGMDYLKGHVSTLAVPESQVFTQGMEEIYQEQLKELEAWRQDILVKKVA